MRAWSRFRARALSIGAKPAVILCFNVVFTITYGLAVWDSWSQRYGDQVVGVAVLVATILFVLLVFLKVNDVIEHVLERCLSHDVIERDIREASDLARRLAIRADGSRAAAHSLLVRVDILRGEESARNRHLESTKRGLLTFAITAGAILLTAMTALYQGQPVSDDIGPTGIFLTLFMVGVWMALVGLTAVAPFVLRREAERMMNDVQRAHVAIHDDAQHFRREIVASDADNVRFSSSTGRGLWRALRRSALS